MQGCGTLLLYPPALKPQVAESGAAARLSRCGLAVAPVPAPWDGRTTASMPPVAMLMAYMAGRVHEVAQSAAHAVFVSSDPTVDAVVLQMQVRLAIAHGIGARSLTDYMMLCPRL